MNSPEVREWHYWYAAAALCVTAASFAFLVRAYVYALIDGGRK